MRLPHAIVCVPLLLAAGCQPSKRIDNARALADSALAVHFGRIGTLRHYDTATFEHRLLEAVYRRDTVYLKQYLEHESEVWSDRKITMIADSSLGLTPLHALGADQAYRFQWESAFASSGNHSPLTNLGSYTITRSGDKVQLQVIYGLYESAADTAWRFRTTIHYKHDTALAVKEWEALEKALRYCDFWGMKADNDRDGSDGGITSIEGYSAPAESRLRRHHYVFRWVPYGTALDSPMRVMRRLSGGWPGYY